MMCTTLSKQDFDILYELMETDDAIRAQLDAEPKEKQAMS